MTFDNIGIMAKYYGSRPSTVGIINFGTTRINKFKLFVHLAQGFWGISEFLRIKGIAGIVLLANLGCA